MYQLRLMKYLIPLFLLSVFLIPLAQSSYAQQQQQNEFQGFFSQILPKIQNFTHTLNAKIENLKNNASTELNQTSSTAKQGFFSQILPKLQNFTHTLNAKIENLKNNTSP
jgi:molecular chaperone GrpE (heat shock protein)